MASVALVHISTELDTFYINVAKRKERQVSLNFYLSKGTSQFQKRELSYRESKTETEGEDLQKKKKKKYNKILNFAQNNTRTTSLMLRLSNVTVFVIVL